VANWPQALCFDFKHLHIICICFADGISFVVLFLVAAVFTIRFPPFACNHPLQTPWDRRATRHQQNRLESIYTTKKHFFDMKNVVIFLEPKLFKYVITIPFLLL
jgi:hypothetical protein